MRVFDASSYDASPAWALASPRYSTSAPMTSVTEPSAGLGPCLTAPLMESCTSLYASSERRTTLLEPTPTLRPIRMYLPPTLTKKVASFAWLQETVTPFAMV